MVTLFKLLDFPRVLLLLLMFLSYLIFSGALNFPLTSYELMNLVLSECLAEGNTMYKDVFHSTEPFMVWLHYLLFLAFGREILYYRIVAAIIVFIQALMLNQTLNEKNCFDQKSAVPAFLYIGFSLLFPDMLSLSAVLLANVFLLWSLYFLISYIRNNEHTHPLFWIGIHSSLAFLCYAPYILLLPALFFVLFLYTPMDARKFVNILYAFILPALLVWTYYFWNDASLFYVQFYLQRVFDFQANHYLSFQQLLLISAVPLGWLFIGLISIARSSSLINYQYRIIQSMFLLFLFATAGLLFVKERSVFTMWQIIPYVTTIATYFLLLQKKKWVADTFILCSFCALIFIRMQLMTEVKVEKTTGAKNFFFVEEPANAWTRYGNLKTALILDSDIRPYLHFRLATPFLNWSLSEPYFKNTHSYESVSLLDRYFTKNHPHLIIDPNSVMPNVFYRLPRLFNKYKEKEKGIYVLRSVDNGQ